MVFRSKIDAWLIVVVVASVLLPAAQTVIAFRAGASGWPLAALLTAGVGGFMLWLLASTRYTVHDGVVDVRSGPFTWTIAAKSITEIKASRSIVSSPALSLDRLCIAYDQGKKSILVSPRDQDGFLAAVEAARHSV